MTSLYGRAPGAFRRTSALDDQTYTRVVQEAMERFAREGQALIIGRGGQMVLRSWPSALHIHLYAPAEVRIKRLMARANLSELEAKRQITRSDEQKRLYIRNMHNNANWKDLKHYHLAINTGYIPPEVATEIIIQAAKYRENSDQVD
jgi:cytidylate kinase